MRMVLAVGAVMFTVCTLSACDYGQRATCGSVAVVQAQAAMAYCPANVQAQVMTYVAPAVVQYQPLVILQQQQAVVYAQQQQVLVKQQKVVVQNVRAQNAGGNNRQLGLLNFNRGNGGNNRQFGLLNVSR